MLVSLLTLISSALAAPGTPPLLDYLEWDECIEVACYISPTYPVPSPVGPGTSTTYLGSVTHRGPAPRPADVSDLCQTMFAPDHPFGTPIEGMALQVWQTSSDAGLCLDVEPVAPSDPTLVDLDAFDKLLAQLEALLAPDPDPSTLFDPPEGFEWP